MQSRLIITSIFILAEVANLTKLFPLIEKAVGTFGMSGLDRLLGLQATSILQKIVGVMDTNVFKDRAWFDLLDNMSNSLNPIENVITQVTQKFLKKQKRFTVLNDDTYIFLSLSNFTTNNI